VTERGVALAQAARDLDGRCCTNRPSGSQALHPAVTAAASQTTRSIADIVGSHADGPDLQCLGINANLQLARLAAPFRSMLFALPLAFAQELDPC